jgi:hypothetical protein
LLSSYDYHLPSLGFKINFHDAQTIRLLTSANIQFTMNQWVTGYLLSIYCILLCIRPPLVFLVGKTRIFDVEYL